VGGVVGEAVDGVGGGPGFGFGAWVGFALELSSVSLLSTKLTRFFFFSCCCCASLGAACLSVVESIDVGLRGLLVASGSGGAAGISGRSSYNPLSFLPATCRFDLLCNLFLNCADKDTHRTHTI